MRASVFIATSLDGFIARADGGIDWLGDPTPGGEDYGYAEFVDDIDYLVMGRNSYEKVRSFGSWPYQAMKVVVLTSRELRLPDELTPTVEAMSGSPAEVVSQRRPRGYEARSRKSWNLCVYSTLRSLVMVYEAGKRRR